VINIMKRKYLFFIFISAFALAIAVAFACFPKLSKRQCDAIKIDLHELRSNQLLVNHMNYDEDDDIIFCTSNGLLLINCKKNNSRIFNCKCSSSSVVIVKNNRIYSTYNNEIAVFDKDNPIKLFSLFASSEKEISRMCIDESERFLYVTFVGSNRIERCEIASKSFGVFFEDKPVFNNELYSGFDLIFAANKSLCILKRPGYATFSEDENGKVYFLEIGTLFDGIGSRSACYNSTNNHLFTCFYPDRVDIFSFDNGVLRPTLSLDRKNIRQLEYMKIDQVDFSFHNNSILLLRLVDQNSQSISLLYYNVSDGKSKLYNLKTKNAYQRVKLLNSGFVFFENDQLYFQSF
jgi:hypothetical protein